MLLGLYVVSDAIRYFRCGDGEERRRLVKRLRQLGAVTAASVLASLINPYGYKLHVHVYRYLSNRWLMNHIDEFLSPNFHGVAQQCFVAILLITIVALAGVRNKPPLSRLLVYFFAAYSGLYASRSLPVSSLLLTLIVATGSDPGGCRNEHRAGAFSAAANLVCALGWVCVACRKNGDAFFADTCGRSRRWLSE